MSIDIVCREGAVKNSRIIEEALVARDRHEDDPVKALRVLKQLTNEARANVREATRWKFAMIPAGPHLRISPLGVPVLIQGLVGLGPSPSLMIAIMRADLSKFRVRAHYIPLSVLLPNGIEDLLDPDDERIPQRAREILEAFLSRASKLSDNDRRTRMIARL